MNSRVEAELSEAPGTPASVQGRRTRLDQSREPDRNSDQQPRAGRELAAALLQENTALRNELAALTNRWYDVERSLGWQLVKRGSKLRAALFRDGSLRGRCWRLFALALKTANSSGIRVALRKSFQKIARKITARIGWRSSSPPRFLAGLFPHELPVGRFQQLPWRFPAKPPDGDSRHSGYLKMLLVSHSAGRTGAPLCLLRLAQELSRLAIVECWVVLPHGGELEDAFTAVAPTLVIDDLVARGIARDQVPYLIAASFHAYSSRGIAVCNTVAVSEFHPAFAAQKVPVLSWIHELPSFIESLGGKAAIARVQTASHRIMVPAEAVRTALESRFGVDSDRIRTIYNGQDARTLGLSRETMRLRVLEELGLPEDALIVLGCGTVDLRKGTDLFVNVALRVLSDPLGQSFCARTYFIWVGHHTGDDLERWLLHDVRTADRSDQIRFIGPRPDTTPYFMAADVLALTSREDPCPLVNLEAMESGLAVVAFQGAGGAAEVLGDGGISVPYLDANAMARAVRELLANPQLRAQMGRRGQTRIREHFTWSRFMDDFLDMLQKDFQIRPAQGLKVSVIVPNFQHAPFLEERLRSVFNQTFPPHEIIFLDDASSDQSVPVARRLAPLAPVPMQFVVNQENSGNTFRQWIKGLRLATGDLVWIAESDDSADPRLLERLVPEFYDPEVVLAYCQSAIIGPSGEKWAEDFLAHTDDISPTRWLARYCAPGFEEAELALSQKNTIPNASAVVFRRPVKLDFEDELVILQFAGDWFFYAMLIRTGKIAFLPEVLNFYRRHQQTVTHRSVRQDTQPQESLYVKARVFETFGVSANAIASSLARSVLEYDGLSERLNLERPALTANPHLAEVLNRIRTSLDRVSNASGSVKILLVVDEREACEESAPAVRLANDLAAARTVFLATAEPQRRGPSVLTQVDERVIFLEGSSGSSLWNAASKQPDQIGDRLADGRREVLIELIRFHRIDVILSRSRLADRLVLSMIAALDIPWWIHVDGVLDALIDTSAADGQFEPVGDAILKAATGVFYENERDFHRLEELAIRAPSNKALRLLERVAAIERIGAVWGLEAA
jgi:glycosyltransferase involved in cell wall biosynthesis